MSLPHPIGGTDGRHHRSGPRHRRTARAHAVRARRPRRARRSRARAAGGRRQALRRRTPPGGRRTSPTPTRLAAVAREVADRFSRVDAVVANAGIASGGPLLLADPASFDRVIEVNLLGSVRTARAFLPALVASQGYYLQIASAAAFVPLPMMAAYCASKSGVEAFAHAVRTEVAHHGVDVGVALPVLDRHRHGPRRRRGQRRAAEEAAGPLGSTSRLGPGRRPARRRHRAPRARTSTPSGTSARCR